MRLDQLILEQNNLSNILLKRSVLALLSWTKKIMTMSYEEYEYAKYHLLCYTLVPSQSYEKHYNIISVLIHVLIFERLDLGFKSYV